MRSIVLRRKNGFGIKIYGRLVKIQIGKFAVLDNFGVFSRGNFGQPDGFFVNSRRMSGFNVVQNRFGRQAVELAVKIKV